MLAPPNNIDAVYANLLQELLGADSVTTRNSRCQRLIARTITFTQTPLIGSRRTAWKNALREWEWFMSGSPYLADLHESVISWWQPWENKFGEICNNYSQQFRYFHGANGPVDQIKLLVDGIRDHPFSRRNVITTWNTADMVDPNTPITNCHGTVIQAFVDGKNALQLVTYQRSADAVCGLPHNWIQYWAFLLWLAGRTGREVGSLTWIGGDIHLYEAHRDLAREICDATFKVEATPQLQLREVRDDFLADDFYLSAPYSSVLDKKAEMIV